MSRMLVVTLYISLCLPKTIIADCVGLTSVSCCEAYPEITLCSQTNCKKDPATGDFSCPNTASDGVCSPGSLWALTVGLNHYENVVASPFPQFCRMRRPCGDCEVPMVGDIAPCKHRDGSFLGDPDLVLTIPVTTMMPGETCQPVYYAVIAASESTSG